MRVSGAYTGNSINQYSKNLHIGKNHQYGNGDSKLDVLNISSDAKDFQIAAKAVAGVSDVREDRVKELLSKYESGMYSSNSSDVADSILSKYLEQKNVISISH